jgi:dCTP diphosphatase
VDDLKGVIRKFIEERDWDQFHSPKNLAMALSVEAAETVEHFQWLTEEQSKNLPPEKLAEIREEMGDVMIYLTELADKLGIDPVEAAKGEGGDKRAEIPCRTCQRKGFQVHGVSAMPQVFIFTASKPEAQQHLVGSIRNPIDEETVFDSFASDERQELERIREEGNGF